MALDERSTRNRLGPSTTPTSTLEAWRPSRAWRHGRRGRPDRSTSTTRTSRGNIDARRRRLRRRDRRLHRPDADRLRRPRHPRRRASIAAAARQRHGHRRRRAAARTSCRCGRSTTAATARSPWILDGVRLRRRHEIADRHASFAHRSAAGRRDKADVNSRFADVLRRLPGHAVRRRRRQRGQRQRRAARSTRATRAPAPTPDEPDLRRHDATPTTRRSCWGNVGATRSTSSRPGVDDLLDGRGAERATLPLSGTSMAAPMVAGARGARRSPRTRTSRRRAAQARRCCDSVDHDRGMDATGLGGRLNAARALGRRPGTARPRRPGGAVGVVRRDHDGVPTPPTSARTSPADATTAARTPTATASATPPTTARASPTPTRPTPTATASATPATRRRAATTSTATARPRWTTLPDRGRASTADGCPIGRRRPPPGNADGRPADGRRRRRPPPPRARGSSRSTPSSRSHSCPKAHAQCTQGRRR